MNRPLYTVLYSLLIIAIFFGTSAVYQACGKSGKKSDPEENISDKVEQVADIYTDEKFFEEDDIDNEESEEAPPVKPVEADRTPDPAPVTPSSRLTGNYLVIAGNYLLESNADIMVTKLRTSGYSNAEKVVFDLSQYYTVIAGKYDQQSIANSISSELNGIGIDNYVLKRKN